MFKVWEGGMAFHGGLIGAFIGMLLFARRYQAPALTVMDLCSLAAPIGLFFGRIANFIRPELWGRPTDVPWAVVFPGTDGLPRHPSQIYEALLEGALAFVILFALARDGRAPAPGPDRRRVRRPLRRGAHLLRVLPRARSAARGPRRGLTMGMVLSAPLIVIGLGLIAASLGRKGAEMTTLLDEIKALIGRDGPITVERYMELALAHPEYGYYMNRDPFGASGDFTTAPEISQMFGELLGLWAAEVWASMGSPNPVRLVELGPGRGTLMSDALRAARIVPEFRAALDVWLVETSPTLAAIQHELLLDSGVADRLGAEARRGSGRARRSSSPTSSSTRCRCGSSCGSAANGASASCASTARAISPSTSPRRPSPTSRRTRRTARCSRSNPSGHRFMFELGARLVKQGGAALFVDYGHSVTGFGDTLQALRAHRYVDPLAAPGECDLTAHVDFAAMARSASATGAAVHGPIDQGDFLRAIGIDLRAKALAERADPERAEELKHTRDRLVGKGKGEMGALFKAMAVTNRRLPPPPGFQPAAGKTA